MHPFDSTDRLHLLLALVSVLTGTWWGVGTALLVVLVLAARREARRTLRPSAGVRRRSVGYRHA
jgi:hypothetical protein